MSNILLEPWITPELRKAVEELERLPGDKAVRQLYEARRREIQIHATELKSSYHEGKAEGKAEGRTEEARRLLERMIGRRFGGAPEWLTEWAQRQQTTEALEQALDELRQRLASQP